MKKVICIILSLIFCLSFASCNVHQNEGKPCKGGAHTFVNYKFNNDATCFADGTETAECSNIYCSATHTRTRPNTKLTHLLEFVLATESTCCVSGHYEHYVCIFCQSLFADQNGLTPLDREDVYFQIVDKPIVLVEETQSTCYKHGLLSHYECSVCHKAYVDSLGEQELNLKTIEKPYAPHVYEEEFTPDPRVNAERRCCVNYKYCGAYTDWRSTDPDYDDWWTPNA